MIKKQSGESLSFGVQVSGLDIIDSEVTHWSAECILLDQPGGTVKLTKTAVQGAEFGEFVVHVPKSEFDTVVERSYVLLVRVYNTSTDFSEYVIVDELIKSVRGESL